MNDFHNCSFIDLKQENICESAYRRHFVLWGLYDKSLWKFVKQGGSGTAKATFTVFRPHSMKTPYVNCTYEIKKQKQNMNSPVIENAMENNTIEDEKTFLDNVSNLQ